MLNKVFEIVESLSERHFRALVLLVCFAILYGTFSVWRDVTTLRGRMEEFFRNAYPGYTQGPR